MRGDVAGALHSTELADDLSNATGYLFARAASATAVAFMRWQAGQRRQAIATMELARRLAEEDCCLLVLFGCDLIEADALWDEDRSRALGALKHGLALGRERGYFSAFWVTDSLLAPLAVRALPSKRPLRK